MVYGKRQQESGWAVREYSLRCTSNTLSQLKTVVDYSERFSEKSADQVLDETIDFADSFTGMPMRFPECAGFSTESETHMESILNQAGI